MVQHHICADTHVSSCNNLSLAVPDETVQRQQAGGDVQHGARWLLGSTGVDDSHAAVVSGEGKSIAARGECNTLDPASGVVKVFTADSVEGQALTPSAGLGAGVDTLDEAGEDASVGVGGSGSQQDGVWVPCESCDGAADRLLEVLRDPPVVLLFEVTNSDHSGAGADGEFLLRGRPAHKGRSTIDSEEDEGGLPARGGLFPDVGVAVCTAPLVTERQIKVKDQP